MKRSLFAIALLMVSRPVDAQVVSMKLTGNAGDGLLPGNENHAVTSGGSGGLGPGGITYNLDTNILSIDVLWGSGNGFTDLSGAATASHIHGITADAPPTGFSQNAGVLYNFGTLGLLDTSATSGGIFGNVTISESHEAALLAGKTYINVHTALNGPGEIRGQLTVVPEPHEYAMIVGCGLAAFAVWRRRAKALV